MAALLALGGALCWGIGDFLGGLAARRLAIVTVLAVSQAIGLGGILVWVLASGEPFPGVAELLPAAAAGLAGLVGLGTLYRGFAIGAMGIVAPISAAGPVVPLAIDAARGDVPAVLQWLGIAFVLSGIVILSHEPAARSRGQPRVAAGAGLAVISALSFGLFVVGIDAGADESATWAVAAARSISVSVAVLAALVTSVTLRPPTSLLPILIGVGVFDTGANVFVATATTHGAAGIVAVLSALYPVVTVVLAWLLLGERLSAWKRVGGVVALVGAAFVAAG